MVFIFSELEKEITDDRHLIKILSNGLKRDELDAFSDMAESSTGMPLTDDDVEMLEKAYESLQKKLEMREKIESYVEKLLAEEEMPNLETVVGPLLAARIVALRWQADLKRLLRNQVPLSRCLARRKHFSDIFTAKEPSQTRRTFPAQLCELTSGKQKR